MHKYLPHTKEDIEAMLKTIQANSLDDLFQSIPKQIRYQKAYDIPKSMSDVEITKLMQELANQNNILTSFRGYGAYDVYTPSIVKALTSRQEFLTSYTPYQPEISQGTLQYIFEFQSMICELTDMDVTNASMYDGPTATSEAMFMAVSQTGRQSILVSSTVRPRTIEVIKTYARFRGINVEIVKEKGFKTDLNLTTEQLANNAGIIVQNPNKYGIIENYQGLSDVVHAQGGLLIMNVEPSSLALLKTPGKLGADIACGELQSLGIPLSYGGAYVGFLAAKTPLLRKMPGRICGMTTDVDGKRAFVLTLQAREQHIRRAKANSNICSNQSLMALSVAIYLSSLGKEGFVDLAQLRMDGAHYLYHELIKTKLFTSVSNEPFYNEFILKSNLDPEKLDEVLLAHGYLGPMYLSDGLFLFAVTEKQSKEYIDNFVKVVGELR